MKPRLYLIPGTMCTDALWAPVAARVAERFEPVLLAVPMAPDLASTVAALGEAIDESGARVAGFSLGAYLAASLAVDQPGKVGQLMLASNTPCPLGPKELRQRRAMIEWVQVHGYKGLSRVKARQLVGDAPEASAALETVLSMDAALGGDVFLHQMRVTTERRDLGPALLAAGLPIDLVFSEADPLLDHDWLSRFTAGASSVRTHCVAGWGHLLPLTHPQVVARAFAGW